MNHSFPCAVVKVRTRTLKTIQAPTLRNQQIPSTRCASLVNPPSFFTPELSLACLHASLTLSALRDRFLFRFPNRSTWNELHDFSLRFLPRKEVIQPHLPIRLPCYDFTPVIGPAFDSSLLAVKSLASGITNSHGVTGGVYKTRERIHRDILIRDY